MFICAFVWNSLSPLGLSVPATVTGTLARSVPARPGLDLILTLILVFPILPELPQLDRQFDDLVSREDEQNYEHNCSEPEVMLAEFNFGDDRSNHYEERQEDCANKGSDFENLVHIPD